MRRGTLKLFQKSEYGKVITSVITITITSGHPCQVSSNELCLGRDKEQNKLTLCPCGVHSLEGKQRFKKKKKRLSVNFKLWMVPWRQPQRRQEPVATSLLAKTWWVPQGQSPSALFLPQPVMDSSVSHDCSPSHKKIYQEYPLSIFSKCIMATIMIFHKIIFSYDLS